MKLEKIFTLERIQKELNEPLCDSIRNALGACPAMPAPDGQIHRFDIAKKGDRVGWYVYYEDGDFACAIFGDWRDGERHIWKSHEQLTEEEQYRLTAHIADMDRQKAKEAKIAAATAQQIYEGLAAPAPDHPYLRKKKVGADTFLLESDGRLVLPVLNADWQIMSLQFISPDGKKSFLSGGATGGGFCPLGLDADYDGPVYMAEGYATAESVVEATGRPCFVAFNAGNLPKAVEAIKDRYPDVTIVADNDASGTGEKYAKQTGRPFIMPPIVGMDANDYMTAGHDLKELLEPKAPEGWLASADDFIDGYKPSLWLIKHWLPLNATSMLYGAPASGKTFALVDMLLSISTGRPDWFGYKVKKGNVVYLAGEGHEGLRKRLKVWKQERGVDSFGNFFIAKSALDLDKTEGLKETAEAIQALPFTPDVIAIDTLNRFYSGDENSAQEMRGFIESCSELQRLFGCAVIIVHHTGVSADAKERARGSSALKGAVDAEILVTKGDEGILTLKQTKQKDIDVLPDLTLKLAGHKIAGWFDEDGDPLTSAVLEEPSAEDRKDRAEKETRIIEEAYKFGGRLKDEEGYPYVDKNALKTFLREREGYDAPKVRNALRKEPYRLIGKLLEAGIIIENKDGWSIRDMETAAALMMGEIACVS